MTYDRYAQYDNYQYYRKNMATNVDFWDIEGLDKIIQFLDERNLNYLIFRLGETAASSIKDKDQPIVMIELQIDKDKMKVIRYFPTYNIMESYLHEEQ